MVLNHASLASAGQRETVERLPEVADGMASLVRDGVARAILRMCRPTHDIYSRDGRSLHDAYLQLRRGARDQFVFLMSLSTKAPLDDQLGPEIRDRFLLCEAKALPAEDGAPLVLCALSDAISISVPSERVWDQDRIRVQFQELLPDASFSQAEEEIDNLARADHAGSILQRHLGRLQHECSDAVDLWRRRGQMFPHLLFGPDVEEQLPELNAGWLRTLVRRLSDLDKAAEEWPDTGGAAPRWRTLVTPESERVMNNPTLREARRFRASNGEQVLFHWHARFGSGARIHLRFDARTYEIEIGYIGVHLPL